jgi:hypothetical protein
MLAALLLNSRHIDRTAMQHNHFGLFFAVACLSVFGAGLHRQQTAPDSKGCRTCAAKS